MHKERPVADIEIDEEINVISDIADVYAVRHLPVGVTYKGNLIERLSLHEWWMSRAIPASRFGIREALQAMRLASTSELSLKCLCLSLSDQYWVCSKDNPVSWSEINFFENEFSEDVGNALFGGATEDAERDCRSPDNTTNGNLKKRWIAVDGKRLLLKGGSAPSYQEPLNEALASALLRRLNAPHATYSVTWDGEQPLSACEDFITPDTELVSAWHIHETVKKPNHLSEYEHFLDCCGRLGIPGMRESLDRLLALDYLIANTDRHFNNFGAVRHAETLEWIGPAPIFDCGTSMWHDQFTHMIRPRSEVASKPFRAKHSQQIELVTSLEWLDFEALRGADEEYAEILRQSSYIDEQRRSALCFALKSRVEMLEEIAVTLSRSQGMGGLQL